MNTLFKAAIKGSRPVAIGSFGSDVMGYMQALIKVEIPLFPVNIVLR